MGDIIRELKEEDVGAVMTCVGLGLIFIGMVGVFFSGFVAGNFGAVAAAFFFALGTIFVANFRGRKNQTASRMTTLGRLLAAVGAVLWFVVGLVDCNCVAKFGGFLALAGVILLAGVWVWEEKIK